MAKASTTPSLFILNSFLLASICLLQSLQPTSANKTFVLQTCNSTSDADLCSSILLSDPRSVNTTSIAGLASIALDIAIKSADAACSHAADLSDKYSGLPEEEVLNLCKQYLSDAADDLRDAQDNLNQQEFQSSEDQATNAEDGADNCEKAFSDKGIKSLMSDVDKVVHDQANIAGDIVDLLYV